MIDLGERRDGALASPAAGALLDRDRGRDSEDRVHVGPRRALNELARIGIQRFEVSALAFCKKNVEGEGGLAGAGNAGDDGELVARDLDVDGLQVVLSSVVDPD